MLGSAFKKARVFLATAVILAITAGACQSPSSTSTSGGAAKYIDGGTLRIRNNIDYLTLDTIEPSEGNRTINQFFYDRLVDNGPNNTIIPYVAKSWEETDKTITFNVRNDVTCVDGAKLTPTAIANSYKRLFDPATRYGQLRAKYGPGPYAVVGDDAAGTVKFTFGTVWGPRMYGFAEDAIVCPSGLANPASLKELPQGSGPYKFESATHNDKVIGNLRPEWAWGPQGTTAKTVGLPSKIIFQFVSSETTAANLLLTGDLDISLLQGPDIPRLQAEKSLRVDVIPSWGTHWISFNEAPGRPGADRALREALLMAFDGKEYNQAANGGFAGLVETSFVAQSVPCYDPESKNYVQKKNIEGAKQKMLAAGYKLGPNGKFQNKDGSPLKIVEVAGPRIGAGGEYVQSQLAAVGIDIELKSVEQRDWTNALSAGNFDVSVNPTPAAAPDPSAVTRFFSGPDPVGGGGGNFFRIHDAELDAAVDKASSTPPGPDVCKNWAVVQKMVIDHAHLYPLASLNFFVASRNWDFVPFYQSFRVWSLRHKAS